MTETVRTSPPPESGPQRPGDDTGRLEDASKARLVTILLLIVLFSELVPMQYLLVTPAVQQVGLSFPSVGSNLSWMLIILGLVGGATSPLLGKLSDLYGKKRVLLTGGGVFLAGSVLCAVTSSWALFLTGRGLQATALGMAAVVPGLIRDLMPRRYVPMGIGLVGAGFGLSALVSPFLAGLLTDHFGWRSIFWFLAVYTVVLAPVFWVVVPETRLRVRQRLDWVGSVLLGAGAALVLLYLSNGQAWGWGRADALAYLAAGVALLAGFRGWEKRTSAPIMDLALLRAPRVAIVMVVGMIIGAQSFMVPYMAQTDGELVGPVRPPVPGVHRRTAAGTRPDHRHRPCVRGHGLDPGVLGPGRRRRRGRRPRRRHEGRPHPGHRRLAPLSPGAFRAPADQGPTPSRMLRPAPGVGPESDSSMQPITCRTCDTRVLVAKYSAIHTSVQWLGDAAATCPEFAGLAEQGTSSAFVPSCPALRETIGAAVRDGRITESRFSEPAPLPVR